MIKRIYKGLDSHMQELLHGASIAFILKIIAAGLGFTLNLVIARNLGASGSGLYFLSLMVVGIAVTVGQFGTSGTTIRFVSAAHAKDNWAEVKGVYRKSVLITFTSSLILSLLLFLLAPFIAKIIFNKPDLEVILKYMSISVLPISLYSLHASALQGLKKIKAANIVVGISAPLLTIIGCYLLIPEQGIVGASIAYTVSAITTLLIGILLWKKNTSKHKELSSTFKVRNILKSCIPLLSVSLFNLILTLSAPLFLGVWGTEEEVGVFHIANRVAMLTSFILVAVNSIFAPKLSACFAKKNLYLAGELVRKVTIILVFITTPIIIPMIFFSEEIMLIFGDEFASGSNLLIVLALSQFINVATGPVSQILIMSGNEVKLKNAFAISAICVLCSSYYLILEFKALGAAYSVALGVAMSNIIALFYVYKHVNIHIFNKSCQ